MDLKCDLVWTIVLFVKFHVFFLLTNYTVKTKGGSYQTIKIYQRKNSLLDTGFPTFLLSFIKTKSLNKNRLENSFL